jgi:hypothetical protein
VAARTFSGVTNSSRMSEPARILRQKQGARGGGDGNEAAALEGATRAQPGRPRAAAAPEGPTASPQARSGARRA